MAYDDRREIFERLEDLERLVRSHGEGRDSGGGGRRRDRHRESCDHRGHDHGRDRDGDDDGFDEKRVIDTIVRLVTERVARIVQDQQGRSERREDGGGEKRIVDLIVGLVSEHVQEIVSAELDRRFGPGDAKPASRPLPPPDSPESEQS